MTFLLYFLIACSSNKKECNVLRANLNKNVAVLLGGIHTKDGKHMSKLKKALELKNLEVIDDIEIDTVNLGIRQQAMVVYKSLKDRGITKTDNIVIIGHSQGGLRGYELYRLFKEELNIIALFTISTPWKGASILSKLDNLSNNVENIKINLEKSKIFHSLIEEKLKIDSKSFNKLILNIDKLITFLKDTASSRGAEDMYQKSNYIMNLEKDNSDLIIFNIAGFGYDPFKLIGKEYQELKTKLDEVKNFITNEMNSPNVIKDIEMFITNSFDISQYNQNEHEGKNIFSSLFKYFLNNPLLLIENIEELLNSIKDIKGDLVLTSSDQELPEKINFKQCSLRLNKGKKLKFDCIGIHDGIYSLKVDLDFIPNIIKIEDIIYNKDEVIEYITSSLESTFGLLKPILKDQDVTF